MIDALLRLCGEWRTFWWRPAQIQCYVVIGGGGGCVAATDTVILPLTPSCNQDIIQPPLTPTFIMTTPSTMPAAARQQICDMKIDIARRGIPNVHRPPLDHVLDTMCVQHRPGTLWMEFGVASGRTINRIASATSGTVYGFDSFLGLPEMWREGFGAGMFSSGGNMPAVASNVRLIKGWFDQTLPVFLQSRPDDEQVSLLHIDCDLYSSTIAILNLVKDRLATDCIVIFDELLNFPEYDGSRSELRAWSQFVAENQVEFSWLAINGEPFGGDIATAQHVAVVIHSVGGTAKTVENAASAAAAVEKAAVAEVVEKSAAHRHLDYDARLRVPRYIWQLWLQGGWHEPEAAIKSNVMAEYQLQIITKDGGGGVTATTPITTESTAVTETAEKAVEAATAENAASAAAAAKTATDSVRRNPPALAEELTETWTLWNCMKLDGEQVRHNAFMSAAAKFDALDADVVGDADRPIRLTAIELNRWTHMKLDEESALSMIQRAEMHSFKWCGNIMNSSDDAAAYLLYIVMSSWTDGIDTPPPPPPPPPPKEAADTAAAAAAADSTKPPAGSRSIAKTHPMSPQAKSDMLRLLLLWHYGGVWADTTMLCCRPLDEWVDDYVVRQSAASGMWMYRGYDQGRGGAVWLIASMRHSPLLRRWIVAMAHFWQEQRRTGASYVYNLLDDIFMRMMRSRTDCDGDKTDKSGGDLIAQRLWQHGTGPQIMCDHDGQAHCLYGSLTGDVRTDARAHELLRAMQSNGELIAAKYWWRNWQTNQLTNLSGTWMLGRQLLVEYVRRANLRILKPPAASAAKEAASASEQNHEDEGTQRQQRQQRRRLEEAKRVEEVESAADMKQAAVAAAKDAENARLPVVHVIVARYEEDVAPLREVLNSQRDKLNMYEHWYEKCSADRRVIDDSIPLPNVGREAHTYLTYIIQHYVEWERNPAVCDYHAFMQARYDDSMSREQLIDVLHGRQKAHGMWEWTPGGFDFRLQEWQRQTLGNAGCTLGEFWYRFVFADQPAARTRRRMQRCLDRKPDTGHVWWNATFRVSRQQLLRYPLATYQRLLAALSWHNSPESGHFMERTWWYMFVDEGDDDNNGL
jgi:hypothetical protein